MQTTINVNLTIDELKGIIASEISKAIEPLYDHQQQANEQIDPNELLKIGDVAKMFKVSKVTIYEWKKAGKIPFHRIARKVYFKRSEMLQALRKIGA